MLFGKAALEFFEHMLAFVLQYLRRIFDGRAGFDIFDQFGEINIVVFRPGLAVERLVQVGFEFI